MITPPTRGIDLDLSELWAYRELLYFLTWRDIKVRYKQTIIGIAWAVIQPFTTMVVFSLFFGKLANVPSDGLPYPIFAYAALVPWQLFANGVSQSANSLVGDANLIRKIYFPRLMIPLSSVLSGLVDFTLAFLVLLGMMFFWGIQPTANIIWLPFFIFLAVITTLGIGLWLSALNVKFRDVRYVLPFVIQLWLFITPIAYPSSLLEEPWRTIYALNPMAGVVEGFRWALLGVDRTFGLMTLVSFIASLILLVSGMIYFQRVEGTFADII